MYDWRSSAVVTCSKAPSKSRPAMMKKPKRMRPPSPVVYWYGSWVFRQRRKYFMWRSLVNVVEDMVTSVDSGGD